MNVINYFQKVLQTVSDVLMGNRQFWDKQIS
jgi:hypothetical protein